MKAGKKKSGIDEKIAYACQCHSEAALLRADTSSLTDLNEDAKMYENIAEQALALKDEPIPVAGGEIVAYAGNEHDMQLALSHSHELKNKPMVAARASQQRLQLAEEAGVLSLAADALEGIENPTAIEKMLGHQIAAAHKMAMKLMAKADDATDTLEVQFHLAKVSVLIGQAAKLMRACQSGLQALMKARNGGKQEVVVQHIHVEKDAQAVVAAKMDYPDRGAGRKGRGGGHES